jgi:hypothetical protein
MLITGEWRDKPESTGIYWCHIKVNNTYEVVRVCQLEDGTYYALFPGVAKMVVIDALSEYIPKWYGPIPLADFAACKIFPNGLYAEQETPVEPTKKTRKRSKR